MDKPDQANYDTLAMRTMMRRLTEVTDTMHNQGLYIDMSKLKNAARLGLENLSAFEQTTPAQLRDSVAHYCLAEVLVRTMPRKMKKRYKRMQWDPLRKSEPKAPFKLCKYVSEQATDGYQEHVRTVDDLRMCAANLTYATVYGLEHPSEARNEKKAEV